MPVDNNHSLIGMKLAGLVDFIETDSDKDGLKRSLKKHSKENGKETRIKVNKLLNTLIAGGGFLKTDLSEIKVREYADLESEFTSIVEHNFNEINKSEYYLLETDSSEKILPGKDREEISAFLSVYRVCKKTWKCFKIFVGLDVSEDMIITKLIQLEKLRSEDAEKNKRPMYEKVIVDSNLIYQEYEKYEKSISKLKDGFSKLIEIKISPESKVVVVP